MVIELKTNESNPTWKPELVTANLAEGDYVVFSVDKLQKESSGKFGKSFFCFVNVYEYSYYNPSQRKAVDMKFPEPQKACRSFQESHYKKVSEIGLNELIKLEAVLTKSGKIAFDFKKFKVGENSSTSDGEIIDVQFKNDGTVITELEKSKLKDSIKAFKEQNFTNEQIISFLKDKISVDILKEML